MKKYFLLAVLNLVAYTGFSQSASDMLSYILPEGWDTNPTGDNTELLKKGMESDNCKIVFFKPVKIVTETENIYIKHRNELLRSAGSAVINSTPVQMQSGPGWTSFSGLQNLGSKGAAYSIAFYSISDLKQTVFFAVYSTSLDLCTNELDAIIQSTDLIELNDAPPGDKTRKPATKAKSKRVRIAALKSLKAMVN